MLWICWIENIMLNSYLMTCLEKIPTWEAKRFLVTHEISINSWKLKVHFSIYKSPLLVHMLSYIKPVQTSHLTSWRSILILSSQLRLGIQVVSFLQVSPTKSCIHSTRATRPSPLILLGMNTRIIFCKEYGSISSSLRTFYQSAVTFSLLCPNILLSTLFSNTLGQRSFLNLSDQVSYPYNTKAKF